MNIQAKTPSVNIKIENIPNPVLRRLIEEVKIEKNNNVTAYNRTHNRHNRGR
ncbi:YhhA family cyclophane-containing RiPP [Flavobacterium sp. MEB061]|jgi:hypothetical protein|uniref:YhhA family cyclophane-containing RiPP n=1 Tax=Flavobacterium sp. MEB061 TaxID=1587524 RepID=UPI000A5CCF89|nr:YhhA family cyclophane-containing RiPP [Flavobacterium sp. MEB061]